MVNRCGNRDCHAEFKVLNGGDLYAYERRSFDTEFFWLCAVCASRYDLYLDPQGCVSLRVHSRIHQGPPPHPDGNLRLISRSTRPTRRPDSMPSGERVSSFALLLEPASPAFRMRDGL